MESNIDMSDKSKKKSWISTSLIRIINYPRLIICFFFGIFLFSLLIRYYVFETNRVDSLSKLKVQEYESAIIKVHKLLEEYHTLTKNLRIRENIGFNLTQDELAFAQLHPYYNLELESHTPSPKQNSYDHILATCNPDYIGNLPKFAESLRKYSDARVTLFILQAYSMNSILQSIIRDYNFEIVYYSMETLPNEYRTYSLLSLRWILFHNYLQNLASSHNKDDKDILNRIIILSADFLRFQNNPFLFIDSSSLHSIASPQSQTFKIETLQSTNNDFLGINHCFGINIFDRLLARPVITTDIVGGNKKIMLKYLNLMYLFISGQSNQLKELIPLTSHFPACESLGSDTGVHNIILHFGLVDSTKIWDPFSGPFLDLRYYPDANTNEKGFYINKFLKEVYIIQDKPSIDQDQTITPSHPRDNPAKSAPLNHALDDPDPITNSLHGNNQYLGESLCENYNILTNYDSMKGICDLKAVSSVNSVNICCQMCNLDSLCRAFIYHNHVCYMKNCNRQGVFSPLPQAISGSKK